MCAHLKKILWYNGFFLFNNIIFCCLHCRCYYVPAFVSLPLSFYCSYYQYYHLIRTISFWNLKLFRYSPFLFWISDISFSKFLQTFSSKTAVNGFRESVSPCLTYFCIVISSQILCSFIVVLLSLKTFSNILTYISFTSCLRRVFITVVVFSGSKAFSYSMKAMQSGLVLSAYFINCFIGIVSCEMITPKTCSFFCLIWLLALQ